jgi:hypothetical protein
VDETEGFRSGLRRIGTKEGGGWDGGVGENDWGGELGIGDVGVRAFGSEWSTVCSNRSLNGAQKYSACKTELA